MIILRDVISKRRFIKEWVSIAKLSASICFDDMLVEQKKKCWKDVMAEVFSIQSTLNSKLAFYNSKQDNDYNQKLMALANAELISCNNVIAKYQTP